MLTITIALTITIMLTITITLTITIMLTITIILTNTNPTKHVGLVQVDIIISLYVTCSHHDIVEKLLI
jgi:hypothetical protein